MMVDLLQKRLKLVFEDGFLISNTFFGREFEEDPRFFDTISTFSIFGKLETYPIKGPIDTYYEKVEIDAFRKFLINREPKIGDFNPETLSVTDVPKILNVIKDYSFEEKKSALSAFYGSHFADVRELLSKMLNQIPYQDPYKLMIEETTRILAVFTFYSKAENFEKKITERVANRLFDYWLSSSMNFTKDHFGPFGRWPAGGLF